MKVLIQIYNFIITKAFETEYVFYINTFINSTLYDNENFQKHHY